MKKGFRLEDNLVQLSTKMSISVIQFTQLSLRLPSKKRSLKGSGVVPPLSHWAVWGALAGNGLDMYQSQRRWPWESGWRRKHCLESASSASTATPWWTLLWSLWVPWCTERSHSSSPRMPDLMIQASHQWGWWPKRNTRQVRNQESLPVPFLLGQEVYFSQELILFHSLFHLHTELPDPSSGTNIPAVPFGKPSSSFLLVCCRARST